MKFKDSCLHQTLVEPLDYIAENDSYSCFLRLPYFFFVYAVGIWIAIAIDFSTVMKGE